MSERHGAVRKLKGQYSHTDLSSDHWSNMQHMYHCNDFKDSGKVINLTCSKNDNSRVKPLKCI